MMKTKIRMQIMISNIEEKIAKNQKTFLAMQTKHTINTEKDLFVFVNCVKFKDYEDIIKNYRVGDEAVITGEFSIVNYKAKDDTYKNGYSILIQDITKNIPTDKKN